mgnify:CR=1 FL=1
MPFGAVEFVPVFTGVVGSADVSSELRKSRSKLNEAYKPAKSPLIAAAELRGAVCQLRLKSVDASAALKIAMELVRPNGWISKVGWGPQPLGISLDPLVQKNITLQGSFSHNWPIWERVLALLASGQLDVRPVLGGVWSLESWHEAFEKMHGGEIVKAVLKP